MSLILILLLLALVVYLEIQCLKWRDAAFYYERKAAICENDFVRFLEDHFKGSKK